MTVCIYTAGEQIEQIEDGPWCYQAPLRVDPRRVTVDGFAPFRPLSRGVSDEEKAAAIKEWNPLVERKRRGWPWGKNR